jgi:aldose 1-epimerase
MEVYHSMRTLLCLLCGITILAPAGHRVGAAARDRIMKKPFGKTPDGTAVDLYVLTNARGSEAQITTYGGIVTSLKVPDRNGKLADVVLGYDNLADYLRGSPYFGALVGRYGNRIAKGKFTLNGVTYQLAINNGPNHLHGGIKGFDKVVWRAEEVRARDGIGLALRYLSKDGEENYPGNLAVKVVYTLTDKDELKIDYTATTDKDTVLSLTNHSYFNLAGAGNGDILGHEMMINADRFTPVDETLIPTGELRSVQGTPLDFRKATAIGARINQDDEQLKFGKGYDHNYVLNPGSRHLVLAARVYEPRSGRIMEVLTTQPGVQLYSGNFLDGSNVGKGGKPYQQRYGFCLETQHFPDSPNHPNFPSTILRPGETYAQTTVYWFSARK